MLSHSSQTSLRAYLVEVKIKGMENKGNKIREKMVLELFGKGGNYKGYWWNLCVVGLFYILGWTTLAVLWPNDSRDLLN